MHAALNMSLLRLCLKNIAGNPFRSWVIAIFAALVAGSAVTAFVLVSGVEHSLQQMRTRLGADIMVVPAGNQSSVENALLMGVPVTLWMPRAVLERVRALPQVELASPQLFLSTMRGASCCSVSDMFMIAYDPATDFTVGPWLQSHLERELQLQLGESIGGHYVFVPEGRQNILIYGYEIELAGKLEPTGSGLDQSMFFTFATALEIARLSPMRAEAELAIDPDRISAVMVRLEPGSDVHQAAQDIEGAVPGVTAIESSLLFRSQRASILGLLKSSAALTGVLWAVSLALIGLVASLSTAERRQEVAVLRALGIPGSRVLLGLLAENLLLAMAGGAVGMAIATAAIALFRNFIMNVSGLPFLFPSLPALFAMLLGGLVLSALSVILATLIPILRLVAAEPGTALKEW